MFASEIMNIFEPVQLSLKGYHLCLVKPDVGVSTPEAYSRLKLAAPEIYHTASSEQMERLHGERFREMRLPQTSLDPGDEIKDTLYRKGALYTAMSGSSVFGLFDKPTHFKEQSFFKDCFFMGRIIIMNEIELFFDTMAE